ncbi:MAG: hypothetical protein R2726_22950 [Acidimicrobiales bacterium]
MASTTIPTTRPVSSSAAAPTQGVSSVARRLVKALLAVVVALGLVGAAAGAASADPAPVDPASAVPAPVAPGGDPGAPAVTEASAVAYTVNSGGMAVIDEFGIEFAYQVVGGHIRHDGTGVIELSGGNRIDVTNVTVLPYMILMQASYTGYLGTTLNYSGYLDAVMPGLPIYEGELLDLAFGNEIAFELPGLMLTPTR